MTMTVGRVVHHVYLTPPRQCCHGAEMRPLSEKACLWCTIPQHFGPDDPCPTRCMTPIAVHQGPPVGCLACQALKEEK